ncbi:MAG: Uma2 family endonuclease [Chloroflexota bacterium]|nr:Uma2 family endonuclease [Chloroflexota bacterium]
MVVQTPQEMEKQQSIKTPSDYVTFEEFLTLDIEGRAEWVDGKVEEHISVTWGHNDLIGFLYVLLKIFLQRKKLGVIALPGYPMKLPELKRGREPDLLVVLHTHRERLKPTFLDGAADICIEIVSEESVKRDYETKFKEYQAAGVPEYWIFDTIRQDAIIHVLNDKGKYQVYSRGADGRLLSSLLPEFSLDPALLWQDELPNLETIPALVTAMLAA